jgi:primosomal replication protein N
VTRQPACLPSNCAWSTVQQVEAGQLREVKALVKAQAFGPMAERLARQPIGSQWRFSGFLATPRNGKYPVLHIQDIQQD